MKKASLLVALLLLTPLAWSQDTMMKSDKPAADGSMMKAEAPMDKSAYDLRGLGPQVVAFTTEKAAQSLAAQGTVVYYFAATWCPDCQATYRDLQANFTKLPKGFHLVFVNYDKSADLKKKYGVTYQHTFVLVGPAGEKKKVWSGSATVASLVSMAGAK